MQQLLLFFANDSLMFCKANSHEWSRMIHHLERYERAFGQVLKKDKTFIFSSQMPPGGEGEV